MNLVQEKYIKSYETEIKNVKNSIADFREVIRTMIYLYIVAEKDVDKKRLAYDIWQCNLKINLIGIDKVLDIEELHKYAQERINEIQKITKANQKRRHQKRNDFSLTDEEWQETIEYFDYSCAYCGHTDKLAYEHFIPFSKGGSFTKNNILPACIHCNSSKHDRDFKEWYPKQKFYSKESERKIYTYLKLMSVS